MANEDSADIQLDRRNDIFRGDLVEYSELQRRFPLDSGVIDAINLLRNTIHPSAPESGAILTKTTANELKPVSVGKPGQGVVEMRHLTLDEKWIRWIESGRVKVFEEPKESSPHIVFAPKTLAEQHADTFKKFIDAGIQVRLDAVPCALFHTHPSGNLPSSGDVSQILYDFQGTRLIEGIVTKTETFFLIPSKQTPDLSSSEKYRFPLMFTDEMERQEGSVVEHLLSKGKSSVGAINAARYELLRTASSRYDFGLYCVIAGKIEAERIF